MAEHRTVISAADPYDLSRFIQAQERDYEQALSEIRSGRKRSHWMWYIFPQFDGLGVSSTSRLYAIKSAAEAEAYLRHPVLGRRMLEIAQATLEVEGRSAFEVFGTPDDMKLQSCATLFGSISPAASLTTGRWAYYGGRQRDSRLRLHGGTSSQTNICREQEGARDLQNGDAFGCGNTS
jgi:uncharacterized protein (DUF1810 family)